ncbi:GNAT family N-acetyltransferase [Cytophagaceae bacterium YF14B1]|uniref:GNAT family N-acetyltransferase n=1 Tax=Xanthocytophaga flava TaxID=3048013 RepID=A0AAE3QUZ0_9BACT|nr:GNAT family N-acetyltransferase [Xanthocytophaga flavus]MDJ1485902.1 GNAT family N-acetyltransferase [Xanthocytophaga flavus]
MEAVLLDTTLHIRDHFECEQPSLTAYLKTQASQDVKKRLAACFVIVNDTNHIIGYYTLANHSLDRALVPDKYQKRIPPSYHVPVTLLGRLARDYSAKKTGLGEMLLMDALHRAYQISKNSIGSMAVVVDPIDEKAVLFYDKYGFITLPDSGKMFLPLQTIASLF